MKKRGRLTAEKRAKIEIFSATSMRQKTMAQELDLSTHLIRKVQSELGRRPYPPVVITREMERKIRGLVKAGRGEPRIMKATGYARGTVRRLISKFATLRPRTSSGTRYNLGDEELTAIRKALTASERKIAADFHVPHHFVRAFRRKMWRSVENAHWRRRRKQNAAG